MYIMCSHVRNLAGVGGQHAELLEDISGNICTYIYISPTLVSCRSKETDLLAVDQGRGLQLMAK